MIQRNGHTWAGRAATSLFAMWFVPIVPLAVVTGCAAPFRQVAEPVGTTSAPARETRFVPRAFRPTLGGRWIGNAIAYGPHRDGQAPSGPQPTRDEIREDARLIARHWNLLRVYGARGPAEDLLAVIREDRLPIRVLLGVWLAPEDRRDSTGAVLDTFPLAREGNRGEIEAAVRLANEYRDLVVAISAGNETQVSWSDHRIPAGQLIGALRSLRSRTRVPVTTADDYNFWNKPESHAVAAECDFIVVHAHPMWNGKSLDEAVGWTANTCAAIRAAHPGRTVVLGEVGWATRRHNEGEQARLIKGSAGEAEQAAFFDSITAWARETRTTTFFFEAFDENWKGGAHPDEVEKHWGLHHADRSPKQALARGR